MTTIACSSAENHSGNRAEAAEKLNDENWDDDFEFQVARDTEPTENTTDATHATSRAVNHNEQEESWDDAYIDDEGPSCPPQRIAKAIQDVDEEIEDWDSSDNEAEPARAIATEFGNGTFEEEDKTVTARSTASRTAREPPPPLPLPVPLPASNSSSHSQMHSILPSSTTSPTLSTFSIPLSSTHDHSIYSQEPLLRHSSNSAPHLVMMRSYPHAAGSTPPRKGRRLKKKSRPPEADIFELEDREAEAFHCPVPIPHASSSHLQPSVTPPPDQSSLSALQQQQPPPQLALLPPSSPSLLTRIGSFKRWTRRSIGPDDPSYTGWRRLKASTGPNETKSSASNHKSKSSISPEDISLEEVIRNVSLTPPTPNAMRTRGSSASGLKSGWFFRNGGAAGSEEVPAPPPTLTSPTVPLVSPGSPTRAPLSPMVVRASREQTPESNGEDLQESRGEKAIKEGANMTPTPRKSRGKLVPILKSPMKKPPSRDEILPSSRPTSESPVPNSRPVSMQVDGPRPMSFLFPRHAASVGRYSGAPLASIAGTPDEDGKCSNGEIVKAIEREKQKDKDSGMRGLMQGVRRLSQVGVHKRRKSTGISDDTTKPTTQSTSIALLSAIEGYLPKPAGTQSTSNGLLSPIELDSPVTSSAIYARRGSVPWTDHGYILPSPSHEIPAYALLPTQISQEPLSMESCSLSKNDSASHSCGWRADSPVKRPNSSPVSRSKLSRPTTSPPSAILPSTIQQLTRLSSTRQPSSSPRRPSSSSSQRRPGSSSSTSPPVSSQAVSLSRPHTPIRNSTANPIIISHPETQSSATPRTPTKTTNTSVTIPIKPIPQVPQSPCQPQTNPIQATTNIPTTYSASLGRTASTPHPSPTGLRRNSFGDLKINSSGEHKPSLSTLGEHKAIGERKTSSEHRSLEERKASTNTLGELKIPARISRAQQGLRRDLGMVREFAGCVEQLKRLQVTYMKLIEELCTVYEAYPISRVPSRPASQIGFTRKGITANPNTSTHNIQQQTPAQQTQPLPLLLNSPTKSRSFSRMSNDLNRELARLEQDYGIWWECAELLVELGGGTTSAIYAGTASNPNLSSTHSSSSVLALNVPPQSEPRPEDVMPRTANHAPSMSDPGSIFESASAFVNEKGPPHASPPNPMQWRASTGRHDLSARQLKLLKDMLNTPDPTALPDTTAAYESSCPPSAFAYPSVEAQPWAAWNRSAMTLPSEESSADLDVDVDRTAIAQKDKEAERVKKRRISKLGMLGLRDLLRGLKRTAVAEGRLPPRSDSSLSSNADIADPHDDYYNRRRSPWHQHENHHAHDNPKAASTRVIPPPKSPRRPSLSSIFRLGYKNAKNPASTAKSKDCAPNDNRNPSTEGNRPNGHALDGYGDWDAMSRSDLDLPTIGTGLATVRGRKGAKSPILSSTNLHPYANQGATTPKKPQPPSAVSQLSLRESPPSAQPSTRVPLSTTDADNGQKLKGILTSSSRPSNSNGKQRTSSWSQGHPLPPRSPSRNPGKAAVSGTVRSAPPADISPSDPKLSLTPENIKPLLEYAKEVSIRITDCISEVQTLLGVSGR